MKGRSQEIQNLSLDTFAEFTRSSGHEFLLKIGDRFFVWSDPDYEGDNTIRPFKGNPQNFTAPGFMGRDRGTHSIGAYCGTDVKFVDCEED